MKLMTKIVCSNRGSISRALRGFTPNTTPKLSLQNTEREGLQPPATFWVRLSLHYPPRLNKADVFIT